MIKAVKFTSVALLICAFNSCAPVYSPNAINVPMFTQLHDASVQGSAGTISSDLQAAYSPLNNFGVMVNGSYYEGANRNFDFIEGGAGYYGSIDKTARFEFYGGYGHGNTTILNTVIFSDQVSASYHRFFFQPSIGAKTDVFEGAFSTRVCYVNLYNINVNNLSGSASAIYVEPVITAKVGYKYAKFFVQAGLSLQTNQLLSYYSNPFLLNAGLNLSFSRLYLRSNKEPK